MVGVLDKREGHLFGKKYIGILVCTPPGTFNYDLL